MDLLYQRYASPMELMNRYINQGRFGEFVSHILNSEYEKKKAEADKENERMLWEMYIHSMTDKSFNEWKQGVLNNPGATKSKDEDMTDSDVETILNKFFPE